MLSSNLAKNGILKILNDLDSAGRGRKRDEEEGGTMSLSKKGRGARREEESEKVVNKNPNEKVAKGCINGLPGPCFFCIPTHCTNCCMITNVNRLDEYDPSRVSFVYFRGLALEIS